jgi:hypothetical protein
MQALNYVLAVLFAAAQLAGTSVEAQNLAAAAASRDCPFDAPDSLEISWTRPCYENDWVLDTQVGCRIGDWHPGLQDRAVWSGACPAGSKEGKGVVQWYEHGHAIDRFEGTFRNGKREGFGRYSWTPAVSYEGHYANDVPHGVGTVTLLGETFSGTWTNGCLTKKGRVVAIGVERTSCAKPAPAGQRASF